MLWICLTAWAGLFIWYFRMRKKAEDHKLVRRIFCLAATGFIAGTALCLPIGVRKVSGDEKAELQLERGALGSQPTEEKLEVSVGNQKPERITLSVPARAYSAEEIEEAFSAAIEALDEIILGENLSFHTVNRNMDLVTEIPGSPVALSWETDRPLLIDSRGLLSDEIPEEGVEVTLKAELELQGETTEYIRKVQVYPPEIKGRDAVLRALKKQWKKKRSASRRNSLLSAGDTERRNCNMVKSAGSDRSGTYGTLPRRQEQSAGRQKEGNKKKQGRKEKNRCCGIIPKLSAKWFFFWVPGLGCGKYSSGLQWITGKIWRLAGRNVLPMKRLYLPARRWKTVFPSRKRTSAWECVWEPERIVPLLFC